MTFCLWDYMGIYGFNFWKLSKKNLLIFCFSNSCIFMVIWFGAVLQLLRIKWVSGSIFWIFENVPLLMFCSPILNVYGYLIWGWFTYVCEFKGCLRVIFYCLFFKETNYPNVLILQQLYFHFICAFFTDCWEFSWFWW